MSILDAVQFREAGSLLAGWTRPLLVSHEKPDGDALGSLVALRELLRRQDLQATALLFDPLGERYAWFRPYNAFSVLGQDLTIEKLGAFDGIVVLDTCAFSQLRPIADWLRSAPQPKLVVDHHATRDALGATELVEVSAAATCLVLYDWARTVGWTISTEAAEALFIGIATDTGWFRHSNTDERVLSACADLVARGVRANDVYQAFYEQDSPGRVRLLGSAIRTLELLCHGQLAVMTLDAAAFAQAGAMPADTEDIVNEPLRMPSVLVSVLLVEQGDGLTRVSLRGRSERASRAVHPVSTDPNASPKAVSPGGVDVADIAGRLGGGGHRTAAGVRLRANLAQARGIVIAAVSSTIPTR